MISFNDREKASQLLECIRKNVNGLDTIRIMEVCGTHTMEIGRLGIRSLLPESIDLISGPGCPVCVTPASIVDSAVELALQHHCTILTFGDMVRVPGSRYSLEVANSKGAIIETLLSPLHAIALAESDRNKKFVFIAVGFETTTPSIAKAVLMASEKKLDNLSFLIAHRLVPPALSALLSGDDFNVDGFLLPGHVVAISGMSSYISLLNNKIPSVVTGFESLDILLGITAVTDMIAKKKSEVLNMYTRVVKNNGNQIAVALQEKVFETCDAVWRGIGKIPMSGLQLKDEFAAFDAQKLYNLRIENEKMPDGCSCGAVLKGLIKPLDCQLFKTGCTPETPVGPCMVSSEGACAAYYKYGGR